MVKKLDVFWSKLDVLWSENWTFYGQKIGHFLVKFYGQKIGRFLVKF